MKCFAVAGVVSGGSVFVRGEFPKYPAMRVEVGVDDVSNMLVWFNGDFLNGCTMCDTKRGIVDGLAVNSKGQLIVDNGYNEVVPYMMSGNIEIWAVDDGMLRDIVRTRHVRKIPDGIGYYGFWRFPKAISGHMERIA